MKWEGRVGNRLSSGVRVRVGSGLGFGFDNFLKWFRRLMSRDLSMKAAGQIWLWFKPKMHPSTVNAVAQVMTGRNSARNRWLLRFTLAVVSFFTAPRVECFLYQHFLFSVITIYHDLYVPLFCYSPQPNILPPRNWRIRYPSVHEVAFSRVKCIGGLSKTKLSKAFRFRTRMLFGKIRLPKILNCALSPQLWQLHSAKTQGVSLPY